MADALSNYYNFIKIEVGASDNTWGGKTNTNWDLVDTTINAIDFRTAAVKATLIGADRLLLLDSESDPVLGKKYATVTSLLASIFAAPSFLDSVFEVKDDGDPTKKLKFQISGLTTATTRTITWPDLSGTVALLSGAQTFTDKTFTQPVLILKQGAAEAPTAEGDVRWDTDDNYLVIGDGAATKIFLPVPSALAEGDLLIAGANGKSLNRLAKSTKGKFIRMNAAGDAPVWGSGGPDAIIEDRKASGTDGGTFSAGSWLTRTLNTEVYDPDNCVTLSTNQMTFDRDGWVEFSAPAFRVNGHQARLYNVTDSTVAGLGTSEMSNSGAANAVTRSFGGAPVEAGKAYRLEHRSTASEVTDGGGQAANLGNSEVYSRVQFWSK